MRLFRMMALIAVAAMVLCAQEQVNPPKEASPEATIISVKTLTGDSFGRLVKLLGVFNNARFTSDERLRIIVIYAPKDVVAQMRKVITDLDRPGSEAAIGHNIEMTMSFLKCSTKAPATMTPLPADLEPVAKQLRAATQYKDIQLWETLPLQLQEGKTSEQSGRIAMPSLDTPGLGASLTLRFLPESVVSKPSGRYVRFERLNVGLRVPVVLSKGQWNFQEVGFNTSGEFKEGQKSVLGKLSGVDDDSAVFVVISLKVVD